MNYLKIIYYIYLNIYKIIIYLIVSINKNNINLNLLNKNNIYLNLINKNIITKLQIIKINYNYQL